MLKGIIDDERLWVAYGIIVDAAALRCEGQQSVGVQARVDRRVVKQATGRPAPERICSCSGQP